MGKWFERLLWGSRLLILVAVVASVLVALCALYVATVDVVHLVVQTARYTAHSPDEAHAEIVTTVVRTVDGYLLTAVMLIFAMGLYELFIGKIDAAEASEVAPRLLLIRSLDDLKDRLAKVVVLILVITFFQQALALHFGSARDLVYLALGTLLVGGALYLSSRAGGKH